MKEILNQILGELKTLNSRVGSLEEGQMTLAEGQMKLEEGQREIRSELRYNARQKKPIFLSA